MENKIDLVAFVEKIEELVENKNEEFFEKEIDGKKYINKSLYRVERDIPRPVVLNSLDAIIAFTKNLSESKYNFDFPIQIFATESDITISSSLDSTADSILFARALPNIPKIRFGQYMTKEEFIIQIQTCFEESENKQALLKLVSTIAEESKVESNDNGISQTVQTKSGVMIKNSTIPPIVELTAYRTYQEIEQPSTMYLLRAREGGQLALFEADGGAWKYESQKKVVKYLKENLEDMIEKGDVVIVG